MGETIAAKKSVLVGGTEVDAEAEITVNGKPVGTFRDLYNKLIKSKQAVESLQAMLVKSEKAYDKAAVDLDASVKKCWEAEQKWKGATADARLQESRAFKAEFALADAKSAHDLVLIENNALRAEVNAASIEVTAMKGAALYAEKRAADFEAEAGEWKRKAESAETVMDEANESACDQDGVPWQAKYESLVAEVSEFYKRAPRDHELEPPPKPFVNCVDPRVDALRVEVDSLKYQVASIAKLIDPLGVMGLVTTNGARH